LTTALNVRLAPVLNGVKGPDTVTVIFGAGFEAVLFPPPPQATRLTANQIGAKTLVITQC
jgi:hypothetical protein